MPQYTIPGADELYWLVSFDKHGAERNEGLSSGYELLSERILDKVYKVQPSHVILFSHGWMGDLDSAKHQFDRWFCALLAQSADVRKMGPSFCPLLIGLHWPSLPFGEEQIGQVHFDAPLVPLNRVLEEYIAFFDPQSIEVRQLLTRIIEEHRVNAGAVKMPRRLVEEYQQLALTLGFRSVGLEAAPEEDGAPFDPVAVFEASQEIGSDFSLSPVETGLLTPLRQLSFWMMKKRARVVGEHGIHKFLVNLQKVLPEARFQLLGHSFGCIVVSAALGGIEASETLPRPADSIVLLQGAVSLWAYADQILGSAKRGYFNATLRRPTVRGPILTTRSKHDLAVGVLYPLAVGLVAQASFDGALPIFGGIGTWGMRGCGEQDLPMQGVEFEYDFQPGGIYNLEASKFIPGHSAIDGPQIAHAIWQVALAQSKEG